MGLTIHYSGCFKEDASLAEMIEEVKEIADIYKWEYRIFENSFPDDSIGKPEHSQTIYGISVIPPHCEPLYLCFLSDGRMSSYQNLEFWGGSHEEEESPYLTMLSTKTQFAGPETHKLIIHLLQYLNEKYFRELEVFDETSYWETGDEKLMEERFKLMSNLLDQVAFGLENFPKNNDESFETYFERLLKVIHTKSGNHESI